MLGLDGIWVEMPETSDLVDLREHVIRLCFAADEIERRSGGRRWAAVSNNLHMAASITDVHADTDLRGGGFMCGHAAD